jgi:NAD(P)H-flavin reductase
LASLKPGDEAQFKGPYTKLAYEPNAASRALFIAGGSGVTPAYQLIRHALADKADKTKFTFMFANVAEKDVLLRQEWETLAAQNPDRLNVVFFLDKAPAGWKGEEGYVTADKIQKHFPKAKEGENVKVYVCGPPAQYAAVSGPKKGREQGPVAGALGDLGYTSEEVFKF